MLRFVLLVAVAFCVAEAYLHPHDGHESSVHRNNAGRQLAVNARANMVGAGTGTAFKDGVPGTPYAYRGYGGHHGGHGGHGGAGGYGGYGGYGGHHGGYGGYGGYGY